MTSAINTGPINAAYPVPGQNQSSQPFRDNFSSIKQNLNTAGTEITDLQAKAIFKTALTGQTLNNDMANSLISNALTSGFRQTTNSLGTTLAGTVSINISNGDYQFGTATGNISLNFANWAPSNTYSAVTVSLGVTSNNTITLPATVSLGNATIENYNSNTNSITVPANVSQLTYVFSTINCGNSISITPVDRSRQTAQIVTRTPVNTGALGDRSGDIAVDNNYFYVCTGTYDGSTPIWKRASLASY
jgi:hypothetical protein